jgi:hypothetical protein
VTLTFLTGLQFVRRQIGATDLALSPLHFLLAANLTGDVLMYLADTIVGSKHPIARQGLALLSDGIHETTAKPLQKGPPRCLRGSSQRLMHSSSVAVQLEVGELDSSGIEWFDYGH